MAERHPDHDCPGGCGRRVVYARLACPSCWLLLPAGLRRAVEWGGPRRLANVSAALGWYRDYREEAGRDDRDHPPEPHRCECSCSEDVDPSCPEHGRQVRQ